MSRQVNPGEYGASANTACEGNDVRLVHAYGEMYWEANSNPTVIESANAPIMIRQATVGSLSGWTFNAGSTGAITAYADYSGTVTGAVLISSAAHGLATGDHISIRGAANYLGIYEITKVDDNSFYIIHAWSGDDGASDWDEGSYLQVEAGSEGTYSVSYNLSGTEGGAGGSTFICGCYVNEVECPRCISKRKMPVNDYGPLTGHSIITFAAGDRIYLAATSTGTNNITFEYGDFCLHRL